MKRPFLSILMGAIFTIGFVPAGLATEILRWERLPLPVTLVVGQERTVFVDRDVRVGLPAGVGDRLRVQSAGGAVYLRASAPIPTTRVQLQDVESGALILVDVTAVPGSGDGMPLEPVRIVDANTTTKRYGDDTSAPEGPSAQRRETPIPVVLTRYAAQNLYAPLRTVEPVTGIGRVNLHRDLALNSLLPTLPVHARALAAWRLEDFWVTAVLLTNTSSRWLDLDPRAAQGDFVTATFQHPDLGPAGGYTDTTVVYLVTRGHGLAESLLPTLSPIDATVNMPPARAAGARSRIAR
ncbi:TIGR03749 family integrating conjugative element protein [Sinimarinibacterium flocculans]|uniref:Integrating conjugative element protein (TIGR03749 family) n=1 Tax=Sinimarinibacterium flocculans TaxID=985250 RepID=A0A318E7M1_9GAMM|nr:TIGR03749 family integrating conjugative element protein [Sinimarinibacterium flocculans]PXV67683.1 integrating conjugative element protein (TIGR03749 family) [Sinimarinibacterium flocculans]